MLIFGRPTVTIDLARVRANAEAIKRRTGVPLIAVVKADAYGLGSRAVAQLNDLVEAFYVFDAAEVNAYADADITKPTIAMLGVSEDPADYIQLGVRPAVWEERRARRMRKARPVLSLDTGQSRFGCLPHEVDAVLKAGGCEQAMSHATTVAQARRLREVVGGRVARLHAAGTALLDEPDAWLDAVRPGLALYHDAVRVTARLVEARDAPGPAGYGGFVSSTGRLGVILAGYSDGVRGGGEVVVNGVRRRVPEVGMQSAFVELGPNDKGGDEAVLLGDGITVHDVAPAWDTTPHEALFRLANLGHPTYTS